VLEVSTGLEMAAVGTAYRRPRTRQRTNAATWATGWRRWKAAGDPGGRGVAPGPPFRGVGPRNPLPTPPTDYQFSSEIR
jgi:hypothetical protein